MELLSTKWLSSEMEMDDSTLNHKWHMMSPLGNNESFDSDNKFPSIINNNITPSYDYNNNNIHVPQIISQKPWKTCNNNSSSSSTIISFGNTTNDESPLVIKKKSSSLSSFVHDEISKLEGICGPLEYGETKRGVVRTAEQAQDHVLAERKRREKLSQKFVALSTLIPGLTKLDKATVLGDAIKYIKELQERVNELEVEVVKGKHNEEAMTFGALNKRHKFTSSYDHDTSSSNENNIDGRCMMSGIVDDGSSSEHYLSLPEIEVRASEEGNLMVRVYCKNQTGVIREVMSEIEKHNISIISSSAMPFGHNSMHITIIAQMDGELELTAKELADNLRTSILNLV